MYLNMTVINDALDAIGGNAISTYSYWSSTVSSESTAWLINFENGNVITSARGGLCQVRFVREI